MYEEQQTAKSTAPPSPELDQFQKMASELSHLRNDYAATCQIVATQSDRKANLEKRICEAVQALHNHTASFHLDPTVPQPAPMQAQSGVVGFGNGNSLRF